MNNLNQHQIQEIHDHSQFDHDEFLQHMMSLTSAAAAFPWADDQTSGHHQISGGGATAMMFQQQLILSRSLASAIDRDDVVDRRSLKPDTTENDTPIKALFNGFADSLGQTTNQSPHFHHSQADSFAVSAAATAAAGQPRQRVRARRGQATDPHSIAERLRRERIAERMKALQELVPNANRTDKASMLEEIIDYVKFLQLQVKVLSTSRLGGVAAVAPLLGDGSTQSNGGEAVEKEGMEKKVAKLLEEDMGSAMQYLQGKGLCLMPISLAQTSS